MLITSRETRRWVIPKGNPIKGLAPHEAAAHEAYEEAGVTGIPCPTALGSFRYTKRRRTGPDRLLDVTVFPLAFVDQAADWPEQDERETRWFELAEASAAVDEPELKQIIARFRAPPRALIAADVPGERRRRRSMRAWFRALVPKRIR